MTDKNDAQLTDKLTIAIPVYNDKIFIASTVESCIGQAAKIVILDNCSTDGTSEICSDLARSHPSVTHIKHEENIGAVANFGHGLLLCETEYFQWVGSHDRLSVGYTRNLLAKLEDDAEIALAYGDVTFINENDTPLRRKRSGYSKGMSDDDPYERMKAHLEHFKTCFIIHGIFRAALAKRVWEGTPCICWDDAMLLRIAYVGKRAYDPKSIFYARALSRREPPHVRMTKALTGQASGTLNPSRAQMMASVFRWIASSFETEEDIRKGFEVIDVLRRRYLDKAKRKWRARIMLAGIVIAAVVVLACLAAFASPMLARQRTESAAASQAFTCNSPQITDGDTLRCNGQRVRLLGIDAPELPDHCRRGRQCVEGDPYAARAYLESLTRTTVECTSQGEDRYGRTLARCRADGVDLSCAMVQSGHAERRYSPITCP